MFLKEEKAQGSLEAIILLGAAVGVATMVGLYLKTTARSFTND